MDHLPGTWPNPWYALSYQILTTTLWGIYYYVPSLLQIICPQRRRCGSITGSGRSPGEGHGNPLQYSCLGNPMDRGAWWATVRGVAKESDTTEWLKQFTGKETEIQRDVQGPSAVEVTWRQVCFTPQPVFLTHVLEFHSWKARLSSLPACTCASHLILWYLDFLSVKRGQNMRTCPMPLSGVVCDVCEVAQSCLTLATRWTVASQAPLSMGFSRQEY